MKEDSEWEPQLPYLRSINGIGKKGPGKPPKLACEASDIDISRHRRKIESDLYNLTGVRVTITLQVIDGKFVIVSIASTESI